MFNYIFSRFAIVIILSVFLVGCTKQSSSYAERVKSKREFVQSYFKSPSSPVAENLKTSFKSLQFFDVDTNFIISAKVNWDLNCEPVQLYKDSGDVLLNYPTAKISFELNGRSQTLIGYSVDRSNITSVFIPFYDATNGEETYGGGRYLDAATNGSSQLTLDFNMTYNPYCTVNEGYICPVPPMINTIVGKVLAGEKMPFIEEAGL